MPDHPLVRAGDAAVAVGFFGKIPSRGDFVRAGLSRPLVEAWDRWMQQVLHEAERRLGTVWEAAWQVAPVWRFELPAGHCGPRPVLGLWLPSVDRAGRRFPLMIAAEAAANDAAFLDQAEQVGREAIAYDLTPEAMLARLDTLAPPGCDGAPDRTRGRWWSEGGPQAAAATLTLDGLPDAAGFAGMLHR